MNVERACRTARPRRTHLRALSVLATVFALLSVLVPVTNASAQDPTQIVINEIFYHPPCLVNYTPCPDAPAEFIELYNPTGAAIDVGGWQFIDGVNFTFPSGTLLPAVGYLVIADDLTGFNNFFSRTANFQWTGELSNSGERIALVDAQNQLMQEVVYSDGADTPGAWSVDADGNGDSLSLLDAENADGSSFWWDAATPTPGRVNANDGDQPTAAVDNFVWTVLPLESQPIQVSANIFGGNNVTLEYRINYPGSTQTVPMVNQGGNSFTAEIPASAYEAGELVRFRIQMGGAIIAPDPEDSISWVGTTIADPAVSSDLPIIEWFTSDSNYNAGYNESGSTLHDGVLAFNGVVYDNVGFRIRGAIARSGAWTKRNWKFKFPDHHDFFIDGIDYGVDSIDLQGGFADEARIREYVGHTVADQMGLVASQVQHVRLELNGEFFGLHTLQEHPEGGFLKDNDLDNATLYKGVTSTSIEGGPGVAPSTSINFENWDIPDYINMLAAASIIQNNDYAHGNFYFWYDEDEHERYEGMVWDLDLSQGIRYAPDDTLTVLLENGGAWSYVWHRWKNQAPMFNQVLSSPYRELYLRRVRTLADEWYGTGRYEQIAREAYANIATEWQLDTQKWGFWGGQSYTQQRAIDRHSNDWIDQYYAHINAGGPNGDIPGAQPANPNVELVVEAAPADQRNEHIRIMNNENVAIDMSGWQIGGSTSAVLPPGSVIPSNGSAYVVSNDRKAGFRAVTTNLYVLGEYDALLNDGGGAIQLTDTSNTVHATTAWGDGAPPAGLILNEWNAVTSTNFLLEGDTRLGSIQGNGGDWFELVVTEDNLDIRGWQLQVSDKGTIDETLTFSNDNLWSDLRAGTIITIAENNIIDSNGELWVEDPSYAPQGSDWWIHVVAGVAGSGTYITAVDFKVSNTDWQLAIYDTESVRRFGPAGEGIGLLAGGGVSNTQIGELEEDPSADITPSSNYGDGDESTFGLPNNFADGVQDFSALRPDVGIAGDVNCTADLDVVDALMIAQYGVGNRTDSGGCPVADPVTQLNAGGGDINQDGNTTIVDALLISQCAVGIVHEWCPAIG